MNTHKLAKAEQALARIAAELEHLKLEQACLKKDQERLLADLEKRDLWRKDAEKKGKKGKGRKDAK